VCRSPVLVRPIGAAQAHEGWGSPTLRVEVAGSDREAEIPGTRLGRREGVAVDRILGPGQILRQAVWDRLEMAVWDRLEMLDELANNADNRPTAVGGVQWTAPPGLWVAQSAPSPRTGSSPSGHQYEG
jgi:hypothetical protein